MTASLELTGIGIGPANLSLASLLTKVKNVRYAFFDAKLKFNWHPGLLLPRSEIQVPYLKDLVTLVDPTNPYSFIAYLVKHKRLYRFLNSKFKFILRHEFNQYLQWVSQSIQNLHFDERVCDIKFAANAFMVETNKRKLSSQHLVLGNGLSAHVPDFAKPYLNKKIFHSSEFLKHVSSWHEKRIIIVGGGQSGADIIQHLLDDDKQLPAQLTWVTRRNQFLPMDASAFVTEFYFPNYPEHFNTLSMDNRKLLLQEQQLSSDGISSDLLEEIYRRLYVLECVRKIPRFFATYPDHEVMHLEETRLHDYQLTCKQTKTQNLKILSADIIIFCTGYAWQFPDYLQNLRERIAFDEASRFMVNRHYQISWDGPRDNNIYVQNAARHSHGVADANLSLMAFRSARIINHLCQKNIYEIDDENALMDWENVSHYEDIKHVA